MRFCEPLTVFPRKLPSGTTVYYYQTYDEEGQRAFTWLMALTIGLLFYLGIDAVNESLELAAEVGGPFQGIGLAAIGILATALLLHAIARVPSRKPESEGSNHLKLALMISVGIGLHNFGEGLGIIAPLVQRRPSLSRLAFLGLLGGAPAILGTWIGGLVVSPVFSLLFLAMGAGAVFEVAYEIALMIRRDKAAQDMRLTIATGVVAGMLLLYFTGWIIK